MSPIMGTIQTTNAMPFTGWTEEAIKDCTCDPWRMATPLTGYIIV